MSATAAASRHRVFNNLVLDNAAGAISLPAPAPRVQDNLSDYNVVTPSGGGTAVFVQNPDNRATGGSEEPLTLESWRELTGNDGHSLLTAVREASLDLATWALALKLDFVPWQLEAPSVDGVDSDFFGHQLFGQKIVPGPFAQLHQGMNKFVLWPLEAQKK